MISSIVHSMKELGINNNLNEIFVGKNEEKDMRG